MVTWYGVLLSPSKSPKPGQQKIDRTNNSANARH